MIVARSIGDPARRRSPARCAGAPACVLAALLLAAAPTTQAGHPVRIGGVHYLGDIPTVVADRNGLFARGLPGTSVEYGPSGKRNLERLLAGELDYALMALTPLVLYHLADSTPGSVDDPVILASLVHSTRLNQVVARADGVVSRPADMAGRRVGLLRGTNAEFVWWLFTHYHGLDPDAAEVVDLPIEGLGDALVAGDIDVAVLWEPWTSRLAERLDGGLREFAGANMYTAKWVLVTTREGLERRPADARALLRAYSAAVDWIERMPGRAVRLYAEHAGLPESTLRANWDAMDYDLNLDWSLLATFQQQLQWARRRGYPAAAGAPAGLLAMFADAPLRTVEPAAVGIPSSARTGTPGAP